MRRRYFKAPVTIVIGIKCKNGIAVVCDSRTTDPTTGIFRDDAEKLHIVEFRDGFNGLIAEAGNADYAALAIEGISKRASAMDMKPDSLAVCAEEAIADLKTRIRKQQEWKSEELRAHFEERSFQLMLASYLDGNPLLHWVGLETGLPHKITKSYYAIGCGADLANFLISKTPYDKCNVAAGSLIAAYAVEEIKRFDNRCGGQTNAAGMRWIASGKRGRVVIAITEEGDSGKKTLNQEAASFADQVKSDIYKKAHDRIDQLLDEHLKKLKT